MEVLSEPSLPPLPGQCQPKLKSKPTPRAAMPKQATNPNLNLAQGKTKLSTYIQVADIKYQETQPDEDAQFVDAFVHGLTDKRNRKTCEKKFKEEKKTWKHLKECFPVASQQSQGDGANQGKERGKQVAVDDTAQMQNITPRLRRPPRTREDMEIEKKLREEGRERCQHHRPSTSRQWKGDEINIRHIQEKELGGSDPGARRHATPAPPPSKENRENEKRRGKVERADLQKLLTPVKQAKQAKPDDRGTKRAPESQTGAILPKRTEERAPSPHAPRAVRKRPLGEQNQTQGNIQQAAILPPAKKKKKEMKKKVIAAARKPERTRAPSIPILPSSDDEFA